MNIIRLLSVLFLGMMVSNLGADVPERMGGIERIGPYALNSTRHIIDQYQPNSHDRIQVKEAIERYEDAIRESRIENGPLNYAEAEAQLGLGRAYLSANKFVEARSAFTQSAQIERQHKGLESLGLVNSVELIIESNIALNDFDELANNHHYLLHIYKRNFGQNSAIIVPAILRLCEFYLDAYSAGAGDSFKNLEEANNALRLLSKIPPNEITMGDWVRAYQDSVRLSYLMAVHSVLDRPLDTRQQGNGLEAALMRTQAKDSLYEQGFRGGKKSLEILIEINRQLSPYHEGVATANLADWYLLFHEKMKAEKAYQKAYELMGEDAANYFSHPAIIPAKNLSEYEQTVALTGDYARVKVDINDQGIVKDLSIIEDSGLSTKELSRVTRGLKDTRFRPAFEDGGQVASTHTLNIVFKKSNF